MLPVKTILHPTDFSPPAENAFRLALALAREFGATITVIHVRDLRPMISGEFGAFPVDPGDDRKALKDKLTGLKADNPLQVGKTLLSEGDPATEIVNLVKSAPYDLIVMGTHGRTGLGRLLMGSVAEQVVRKAPCPVLTVKIPAGKPAGRAVVKDSVAVG